MNGTTTTGTQNSSSQQGDTGEQHQQTPLSQTNPLHQYAPAAPATQFSLPGVPVSAAVSAGVFGFVVAGTGAFGGNLHRVQSGDMEMGQAVSNSLVKGAVGGVATAGATAAAGALTRGGLLGLAVGLTAATGISYLLTK